MRSLFRWIAMWVLAIAQFVGLFRDAWDVELNQRYRVRLLVSKLRVLMSPDPRTAIARAFADTGFSQVIVYLDAFELRDWSSTIASAGVVSFPAWVAWAEVTWPRASTTLRSDFGDFSIAKAELAPALVGTPDAPPPPVLVQPLPPPPAPEDTPTRPEVTLTKDLSWGFFERLVALGKRHGWDPKALLMVMQSESQLYANAHNAGGATGLIQFEPSTLHDLGFNPPNANGREPWQVLRDDYDAEAQLDLVERYFLGNPLPVPRGADATDFYLRTFLPAFAAHAREPDFVLAREGDKNRWYEDNPSFWEPGTPAGRGVILVRGLTRRLQAAATGARWREVLVRLDAVRGTRWVPIVASVVGFVGVAGLGYWAYVQATRG